MKQLICSALALVGLVAVLLAPCASPASAEETRGLWALYEQSLKTARYIDLTHSLAPSIPVWKGFGPSSFGPALNPETGKPYRYAADGFEATRYDLSTDQLGTQLDPPAHWAPEYPAIDELPATYAIRPLADWPFGISVGQVPEAPLPKSDKVLQWDAQRGVRVRR